MAQHVELANVRSDEQREVMERIFVEDKCPFCSENLPRHHKKPINRNWKHWLVTENQWAYDNSKLHFLVISRRHLEDIQDLSAEESQELLFITKWLQNLHRISSGALAMRFGEPGPAGATIRHLHAHVIVPDPDGEGPVLFHIGPKK
ncbi:MAG: HIT domain-containing protein [bacterium]|nr:HIT domain-containing protein [bacterium]